MSILDFFKRKKSEPKKEKLIVTDPEPQWKTITLSGMGLPEKSATLLEEYMRDLRQYLGDSGSRE